MSQLPDSHAACTPVPLLLPVIARVRPAHAPANGSAPTEAARPFATRAAPQMDGLRGVPLGSFAWGGHGDVPHPRVRSDGVLILVREGDLRLHLPRRASSHGRGEVIFIPAGTAFSAHSSADADGQVLLIPRNATRNLAPPLPDHLLVRNPSAEMCAEIDALIAAVIRDGASPAPDRRKAVQMRLGLLTLALYRDNAPGAADPATRRAQEDVVRAFLVLAGRELGRERTLSDLAQALGVTTVALDAACREQRGRSALELTYDLRLEQALLLLRDTDNGLAMIAAQLGYSGVGHLTRAFTLATGRSPDSFRTPSSQAS